MCNSLIIEEFPYREPGGPGSRLLSEALLSTEGDYLGGSSVTRSPLSVPITTNSP